MLIGVDASRALRGHVTGTERYARQILHHLLVLPEAADHRWRLYADAAPPAGAKPGTDSDDAWLFPKRTPGATQDNVELCVLPARRLWTHRTLAAEVTSRRPDVLFVPAHVVPFVLPVRRLPPSVVTIHDVGYHYFPQAHPRRQRLYLEWSTRWSTAAATRVIAVSRATADDLERLYGVDQRKIDVISEAAVPAAALPPAALEAVRREYALDRPYALFVGTLQPRKNVVRLAHAYAKLETSVPFDLVLAGAPGWLSEGLLAELAPLEASGRVRRVGYVPEEHLPALMQGARMFCFPSLYEGFGLPILEAQSCGVPVMTANNSSLPEVAGDAALLVDPTDVDALADAMLRLSTDEALRQRLIAAGHENVKRFSWEKAARETLAVLLKAVNGLPSASNSSNHK